MLSKSRELSRKVEVSAVVAMIAAFVAIVFATITNSSIWFDEAFGAYLIRFDFAGIFKFTALDVHPPLYYWALKLWSMVFGTSDMALRSMSVLFAVVALLFVYLIVRRVFGQRTALTALPFVVLSPFLVRYAQEARMYTMVLAIGLAGTYALLRAHESPSRKRWMIYGAVVALGMWTHYFMALVWLAHWVWRAWIVRQKSVKRWAKAFFTKEWVLTHVWAVALFLPWLPWMAIQVVQVQKGFWIPPVDPATLPAYMSIVLLYQTVSKTSPWMTVFLIAFVIGAIYLTVRAYKTMDVAIRRWYLLLIIGGVAPIVLLILLSLPPLKSTFIDRYTLTSAVLLVVSAGVAIARAPRQLWRLRVMTGLLLGILSVIGITNVYHYGNYNMTTNQKSETRQLMQVIRDTKGTAEQPIIASSAWIYYEAAPYSNDTNGVYFIDKNTKYTYGSLEMLRQSDIGKIKDLDAFTQAHPTFWYIGRPGNDQFDAPASNLQVLQTISMTDSITGDAAYKAVQYRVSAE